MTISILKCLRLGLATLALSLGACMAEPDFDFPDYSADLPPVEGYTPILPLDNYEPAGSDDTLANILKAWREQNAEDERLRKAKLARENVTLRKVKEKTGRLQKDVEAMKQADSLFDRALGFATINFDGFTPSKDCNTPKIFAACMVMEGEVYFVTYREAYRFAGEDLSLGDRAKKVRFAADLASQKDSILRLGVYQVAFRFAQETAGISDLEVSMAFAKKMSEVKSFPEHSLAAYNTAFSFAKDDRGLKTLRECSGFAKVYGDLSLEGLALFRVYRMAYKFAKNPRKLESDLKRDAFALEMSGRGLLDTMAYIERYTFAQAEYKPVDDEAADKYARAKWAKADPK